MSNEAMTDRVRKLFRKAESTSSEHERDALLSKAYALLAKHGIEETLARGDGDADAATIGTWEFIAKGSYKLDQMMLVNHVAKTLHCDAVRMGDKLVVYGAKRHLSRVEMLGGFLVGYMLANVASLRPETSLVSTVTFRKSAMTAFIRTVGKRLDEAEKSAVDESGDKASADIVLVSDADKAAAALRENHGNLRHGSGTRRSSVGNAAGTAAGNRVDLGGGGRVSGGARAAIG